MSCTRPKAPLAQMRSEQVEHLLCKRETKFAKSCRSRRNPLKSSKLWQNTASRFFFFLFAFSSEFTGIFRNFHYVFTTVRIWPPANSASTNEEHYAVLSALSSDSNRLTPVCNISRHCRSDAQCTVYSVSAD